MAQATREPKSTLRQDLGEQQYALGLAVCGRIRLTVKGCAHFGRRPRRRLTPPMVAKPANWVSGYLGAGSPPYPSITGGARQALFERVVLGVGFVRASGQSGDPMTSNVYASTASPADARRHGAKKLPRLPW